MEKKHFRSSGRITYRAIGAYKKVFLFVCLFVCLFACLLVCLFVCLLTRTVMRPFTVRSLECSKKSRVLRTVYIDTLEIHSPLTKRGKRTASVPLLFKIHCMIFELKNVAAQSNLGMGEGGFVSNILWTIVEYLGVLIRPFM